jgi:hypothetical protein
VLCARYRIRMSGRTAGRCFIGLLMTLGTFVWAVPGAIASAAEVTSCPGQLLAALNDSSIRTIVLVEDCSLAAVGDIYLLVTR